MRLFGYGGGIHLYKDLVEPFPAIRKYINKYSNYSDRASERVLRECDK